MHADFHLSGMRLGIMNIYLHILGIRYPPCPLIITSIQTLAGFAGASDRFKSLWIICELMVGVPEYKSYGGGFITIITPRLLKLGHARWTHRPPGADRATSPDTAPAGAEGPIDPGRILWATSKTAPRMRWCRQPGHEGAGRHPRGSPLPKYQGELVRPSVMSAL